MHITAKRIKAVFVAVFMLFATLQASLPVRADDTGYKIKGYNASRIIQDSEGNKVSGYAYCLDYKMIPPSLFTDGYFYRFKLSEVTSYTKTIQSNTVTGKTTDVTYTPTDNSKRNLINLMQGQSKIKSFARKLDASKQIEELVKLYPELNAKKCKAVSTN